MPSSEIYLSNDDYDHHKDALIENFIAAYKESKEYRDQFGEGEIRENAIRCLMQISISYPYNVIIRETISNPMVQRRAISLLRRVLTEDQATIMKEAREQGGYFLFKGIYEIFSKNLDKVRAFVSDYDPHIADDKLPIFAEALAQELKKGIKIVCDKLSPELEAKIARKERKEREAKEREERVRAAKAEGAKKRPHAAVAEEEKAAKPDVELVGQMELAEHGDKKEGSPPAAKRGRAGQSKGEVESTSPAPAPARAAGSAFRASSPNVLKPGKSGAFQS